MCPSYANERPRPQSPLNDPRTQGLQTRKRVLVFGKAAGRGCGGAGWVSPRLDPIALGLESHINPKNSKVWDFMGV